METESQIVETEKVENELTLFLDKSGLVIDKRKTISETLGSFFNDSSKWNQTIANIVITDPSDKRKMNVAREYRLELRDLRLKAKALVDENRDKVKFRMADDKLEDTLWLKAGQMITATFENLEGKLLEKEKFAERWEAENKAKLKVARDAEVLPFAEFVLGGIDLSNLSETDYQKFLGGLKLQMEAKLEAESKIKAEKEAKEKAEREERERIALENSRLKAEAIEAENKRLTEKAEADRILKAEQEAQAKILAEQQAKAQAEINRLKHEKDISDIESRKQKKIAEIDKANADAENARLKAEKLKADNEAKAKSESEAIEAKKREGQANKSKKLGEAKQSFIDSGYSEDEAKKIVVLIKDFKIKNVSINY